MAGTTTNGKVTLTYWGLWEDSNVMQGIISDFERQLDQNWNERKHLAEAGRVTDDPHGVRRHDAIKVETGLANQGPIIFDGRGDRSR